MSSEDHTATLQLRTGHLASLDGMRGIAIGLVVLFHCFGPIFGFGWIGVDLFFVLSGFLITRILLDTREKPNYLLNFYMRRVLRIFPVYYFTLLVILILLPMMFEVFKRDWWFLTEHQVWFWTYMSNWLTLKVGWLPGKNMILVHFWSLAIEEQYYLVWPFLVLLFRPRWLPLIIGVLVATSLTLRCAHVFSNPGYYVSTITHLDGLLMGSLLAWMVFYQPGRLKKIAWIAGLLAAIALVVGVILYRSVDHSSPFMRTFGFTLLAIAFFGFISVVIHKPNGRLDKLLRFGPLMWLGKYSYGIYIFHFITYWMLKDIFIQLLARGGTAGSLEKFGASVACTVTAVAIAFASFHLMEKHFLKLKDRFSTAKP